MPRDSTSARGRPRGVSIAGARVSSLRRTLGFTQKALAKRAALDVKTVRAAERGGPIALSSAQTLAITLNVACDSILTRARSHLPQSTAERNRQRVERWIGLWDARLIDEVLALYHDDAVLVLSGGPEIPFGGTWVGKAAIREVHELVWRDVRPLEQEQQEIRIAASDDRVVLEGRPRVISPNGEMVAPIVIQRFLFRDGLIVDHTVSYDTLQFHRVMFSEQSQSS